MRQAGHKPGHQPTALKGKCLVPQLGNQVFHKNLQERLPVRAISQDRSEVLLERLHRGKVRLFWAPVIDVKVL
jgi:hypothetical protein